MKYPPETSCQGFANMHEFSVIRNIIDIVNDTVKENGLTKVTRVRLIIGRMRQIVPEVLEFAFGEATKDTLLENSKLEISFKTVLMKCTGCSNQFEVKENNYLCEKCGCDDLSIIQGRELIIESIDGDE